MFTFLGFMLLLLADTNSPALEILTFYKSHDDISIGRKG